MRSLKNLLDKKILALLALSLSKVSIRLRNTLAGFTHLHTYNSDHSKDCSCLFERNHLVCHSLQDCIISCNLSGGMDMVLSSVLIRIPKHTANVDGSTNLLGLIFRPNWRNRSDKNVNDL